MTRFYALIALTALALMAVPRVERAVAAVQRAGIRVGALAGERWADGETTGEIAVDVIGCVASDISRGETR